MRAGLRTLGREAGVDRVLDQFLHRVGRPSDHLSRRDLLGDLERQDPNAGGWHAELAPLLRGNRRVDRLADVLDRWDPATRAANHLVLDEEGGRARNLQLLGGLTLLLNLAAVLARIEAGVERRLVDTGLARPGFQERGRVVARRPKLVLLLEDAVTKLEALGRVLLEDALGRLGGLDRRVPEEGQVPSDVARLIRIDVLLDYLWLSTESPRRTGRSLKVGPLGHDNRCLFATAGVTKLLAGQSPGDCRRRVLLAQNDDDGDDSQDENERPGCQ